jgi:hypothetical protein
LHRLFKGQSTKGKGRESRLRNQYVPGLIGTEGKMVAAEAELDRVTERGAADDFDLGAVAETHFEKPAAELSVATDGDDGSLAADADLVQGAGLDRPAVIAPREVTRLLHRKHSEYPLLLLSSYLVETEFQRRRANDNGSVDHRILPIIACWKGC